ncbi:MAG: glucosamine-6-phosphate deaminase [Eggerthellaceae bacterium]|nr:glucosamine-6-phosphate deaminase [Eggerthellaceae bacterium]
MNLIIADDYGEMSAMAAEVIANQIQDNPYSVLGLATGSTPQGLYADLVSDYLANKISFANVTTFNLDEYRGLNEDDPNSYRYFMNKNLFNHVDIPPQNTHVPHGFDEDAAEVCTNYEQAIAMAGGINLQLLGLGHNGHIGFNEPSDSFPVTTHCVDLTESTIEANSRLFNSADEVPRQAYTMGIGTIMKAEKILMVVSGKGKADIMHKVLFGPVKPEVPASVLQLHRDVTVIVDKEAGALCF